ncbi:diguanylate cyclase [Bacillus sp. Bva_UNVM-123]|uniref:diguanylate cyclase n=1 Tax=Bacillus sp. Bva_UNVM-123 TaxID=2829798 RepID=UPI00391EE9F9
MILLGQQIIYRLKSSFYDIFGTGNDPLNYDEIFRKMLLTIKELTNALEVTLFSYNEFGHKATIEASTEEQIHHSSSLKLTLDEMNNRIKTARTIRHKLPGFEAYDVLLNLHLHNQHLGFIGIMGKNAYLDELPDEWMDMISMETAQFLYKSQSFLKILSEENKYKQLFRVTEKFHSTMHTDDVLGEIIYTLQEVYPAFTYYLLLSHDNNQLEDLPIKDLEYDSENIAAMQAYVTGTFQFEDSLQEKRSIMYAPLKGKQGVYGVLQVIAPNTLMFPINEVEFISLLANTAGSALENAQLYQQSKQLITDLKLINETSHRLNSNLRLTETITFITEKIINSFDAEVVGFILFTDGETKVLNGSTEFFHKKDATIYIEHIKDRLEAEDDALFIGDLNQSMSLDGIEYRSIMAVPMTQSGIQKGFALVMHHMPYHFSFEAFKLLQSLVHHSTLAFTNAMLREELEKMVVTDHLTKLFSRSYLDEKIHQSMNEDHEGTFIMVDIDNFKSINDTFGHQVGDDVIIQVADLINANIRGTDIGARWGGEELAIYLPGVSLSAGVVIAERLVKKVYTNTEPQVTVSCGVSHWNRGQKESYATLFKRADKALYVAKHTGKNKVVIQENEIINNEGLSR